MRSRVIVWLAGTIGEHAHGVLVALDWLLQWLKDRIRGVFLVELLHFILLSLIGSLQQLLRQGGVLLKQGRVVAPEAVQQLELGLLLQNSFQVTLLNGILQLQNLGSIPCKACGRLALRIGPDCLAPKSGHWKTSCLECISPAQQGVPNGWCGVPTLSEWTSVKGIVDTLQLSLWAKAFSRAPPRTSCRSHLYTKAIRFIHATFILAAVWPFNKILWLHIGSCSIQKSLIPIQTPNSCWSWLQRRSAWWFSRPSLPLPQAPKRRKVFRAPLEQEESLNLRATQKNCGSLAKAQESQNRYR